MKQEIISLITKRINELKYEKVHLKPFINTDQARINSIDRAIQELDFVLSEVRRLDDDGFSEGIRLRTAK